MTRCGVTFNRLFAFQKEKTCSRLARPSGDRQAFSELVFETSDETALFAAQSEEKA